MVKWIAGQSPTARVLWLLGQRVVTRRPPADRIFSADQEAQGFWIRARASDVRSTCLFDRRKVDGSGPLFFESSKREELRCMYRDVLFPWTRLFILLGISV